MCGRRPHLPLDSKSQFSLLTIMVARKRLPLKGKAIAFITTTVHSWTPIFANEKCAQKLLHQLNDTLTHFKVSLIAYALMPTHIHLLLGFPKIEEMSDVMKSFKRLSTRRIQPLIDKKLADGFNFGTSFRMRQPRFDDVII